MNRPNVKRRRRLPRPEFTGNGALVARWAGVCWQCGREFLAGHPIRFVRKQTVHDGMCHAAAIAATTDASPTAT